MDWFEEVSKIDPSDHSSGAEYLRKLAKAFDDLDLETSPCSNCGITVDWASRFCSQCGLKNENFNPDFIPSNEIDEEVCLEVHNDQEQDDPFCFVCGEPLGF